METQKPNIVSNFEAAMVIITTFFVFLFVSAASEFTIGDEPTLIIGELLILVVPFLYLLMKHVDIKSYVRIKVNPKFLGIGLACGVLLLLLNIVVSNVLVFIFGESTTVQQSNQLITGLSTSPTGLTAVVASLALAGICEEFAFRGFLQNSIFKNLKQKNSKYAFTVAVIVSAAVFGLFHFDPQAVYTLAAFVTGLALGYVYHRWNYTTSATAHASMNLIVLALLFLGI